MKQFRFLKLSVAMTGLIGLLTAASGVAATQASASGSPITMAYVSSLTGAGASQDGGVAVRVHRADRRAERRWAA